jgi:hypothetical protein
MTLMFLVIKLQDTTKEAFVVNAVKLTLQHQQFFTQHHMAKVVEVVATYWKNIFYDFSRMRVHLRG